MPRQPEVYFKLLFIVNILNMNYTAYGVPSFWDSFVSFASGVG